jgi:hypothetical protein
MREGYRRCFKAACNPSTLSFDANFETSWLVDSVVTGDAVDGSVVLRLTVTVDAPSHVEGRGDFDDLHPVNLSVTLAAVDTASDVGSVAEEHMVGQIVNLDPAYGRTLTPVLVDLLNFRVVRRHLSMTVHAGIQAWDGRLGAFTDAVVAESAGDFMDTGMKLMAEPDGLLRSVSFARIEAGRKADGQREEKYAGDDKVACTHTSNDSLSHKIS